MIPITSGGFAIRLASVFSRRKTSIERYFGLGPPTAKPTVKRSGRPAFQPTEEQRRQVEAMVGYGIREADIAKLIVNPQTHRPIDEKTLRLHFGDEIARGQVKANAAVAQTLFKLATGGNVAAAIFWAKTRMRWKETNVAESVGKDGGPIEVTDARERLRSRIARLAAGLSAAKTSS